MKKVVYSSEMEQALKDDVEVVYTGGGIYLAVTQIGDTLAVVTNDFASCISYYHYMSDWNEMFMPENMIDSKGIDEMDAMDRAVYSELIAALKHEGVKLYYDGDGWI